MNTTIPSNRASADALLEACSSYVLSHIDQELRRGEGAVPPPPGPAVTVSNQTGAGAHEVAEMLAAHLQSGEGKDAARWTVFDRNLVDKMLAEHDLPQTLARFMPEDRRPYVQDVMDDLFGVIPPSWEEVRLMAETVVHLVDAGHVILVGRGASFITQRMPNVFHVRLVASLPRRVQRIQKETGLSSRGAEEFVRREDRAKGRYVKSHFHVGIQDDQLYHLVVNTDRVPCAEAARLIANAARLRFQAGDDWL